MAQEISLVCLEVHHAPVRSPPARPVEVHRRVILLETATCLVGRAITRVARAVLAIEPDAAIAKLGRVLRGGLLLFHRAHPLRVLLSGKPGAVQARYGKDLVDGRQRSF